MGAAQSNAIFASDNENDTIYEMYLQGMIDAPPGNLISFRDFIRTLHDSLTTGTNAAETDLTRALQRLLQDNSNPIVLMRSPTLVQRQDLLRRILAVNDPALAGGPPPAAAPVPAAAPPAAAVPPAAAMPPAAAPGPAARPFDSLLKFES